ncbi:hypothetical protein [Nonomuraea lactucae]|uniref:hypothetical protein n=1 Tax=Nonomuraea lactucae TaxID=2249762 RepID=UPI0013B3BB9E|nr:hypothetical protein [Nonomuraea lactucae]
MLENSRGKYIGRIFSRRRAKAHIEANQRHLVARDSIISDLALGATEGQIP